MSKHDNEERRFQHSRRQPDTEYLLAHSHFEDEWKAAHDAIFIRRKNHEAQKPYWLPDQLFQSNYHFSFIIETYHLLEEPFEKLTKGLRDLGEKEFIVVGAEKQFGLRSEEQQDRKLIYPVDITWEQYIQGLTPSTFFLVTQPLEFYLHGKRQDWGIVASNDFGIAIVGTRNEARDAFRGKFVENPDVIRRHYLSQAPLDYEEKFSQNYL